MGELDRREKTGIKVRLGPLDVEQVFFNPVSVFTFKLFSRSRIWGQKVTLTLINPLLHLHLKLVKAFWYKRSRDRGERRMREFSFAILLLPSLVILFLSLGKSNMVSSPCCGIKVKEVLQDMIGRGSSSSDSVKEDLRRERAEYERSLHHDFANTFGVTELIFGEYDPKPTLGFVEPGQWIGKYRVSCVYGPKSARRVNPSGEACTVVSYYVHKVVKESSHQDSYIVGVHSKYASRKTQWFHFPGLNQASDLENFLNCLTNRRVYWDLEGNHTS
ncbi:hypothetical protein IE53DRAFT_402619 [Violaceomyces palustris]|uniref:Uncharacterized protein n=1 Tax=Violaceomyces palustris TaxID=1673888 RepID=A0ACD0NND9_9BASI|nr:hypothetical protein IE53DRAFT_402619 [Violaceomyces palustris]